MLARKKKVPSVANLVTEFTGRFQEVVEINEEVVEQNTAIITLALERKTAAEKEKTSAQNFIRNFEKLTE